MKSTLASVAVALILALALWGCGSSKDDKVVLRFEFPQIGEAASTARQLADEYEVQTGVHVELVAAPISVTEHLTQLLQFIGGRSSAIDVYQIDVIWTGVLADHLLDLGPTMQGEVDDFIPALIANDTVGGRLVAVPWFANTPMLYYRKDLLAEAGFDAPPATWDELEAQARAIMALHPAAPDGTPFHGYLFQGQADEGLTCVALEWQVSHGGGVLLDANRQVDVRVPQAAAGFDRARGWVGEIAPSDASAWGWRHATDEFLAGHGAFLRGWTHVLSLARESDLFDQIGVAPLPAGPEGRSSTLGGWQLAVNERTRHPEEAAAFVRFLTSEHGQRVRALKGDFMPSRLSLYEDPELAARFPHLSALRDAFLESTARPSTPAGYRYNELSTMYAKTVERVLDGEMTGVEAAQHITEQLRILREGL